MLSHGQRSYTGRLAEKQQMERLNARSTDAQDRFRRALATPLLVRTHGPVFNIAYLESQLERVSTACLTVQSYNERLEAAVGGVRVLEEKVLNLARLVATTQQFAEQQEAAQRTAAADVVRRLGAVEAAVAELSAPSRAAEWEARLQAVSSQVNAKLEQVGAAAEQRLAEQAAALQAGLEESCHSTHMALDKKVGEAAGRLTEVERKVRAVDEYAHRADSGAEVAALTGRLGSMEDSLAHLTKSDSGLQAQLASLQQAVGQLRTAVVALELRPPLGPAVQPSDADCVQWLERAREALRREVADIQAQQVQLAAGLTAASAAAAAAPATSPHKAVAAQVLGGLQSSLHQEVGRELQALRLAENFLASVTSQFAPPPPPAAGPAAAVVLGGRGAAADAAAAGTGAAAQAHAAAAVEGSPSKVAAVVGKPGAAAAAAAGGVHGGEAGSSWTIAAVPAGTAGTGGGACAAAQLAAPGQLAYPQAPSSQRAVAAAANGALAQLQQQLATDGGRQLAQAAALAAASGSSGGGAGSGSGGLRATFGQMQETLQAVCQLLQPQADVSQQQGCGAGSLATGADYPSQGASQHPVHRSPVLAAGQPKALWAPGGCRKPAASSAAAAARGGGGAALRSLSLRAGGSGLSSGSGGGVGGKDALRESVLGQKALAERRRRLQELYAELQQQ